MTDLTPRVRYRAVVEGVAEDDTCDACFLGLDGSEEKFLGRKKVISIGLAPEPYEPRDGDEITISMRGKVSPAAGNGWNFSTDKCNHWFWDFGNYDVTIHKRGPEPKPKLPTTPDSVILYKPIPGIRILDVGGVWRYRDGSEVPLDYMARHVEDYEVIFDAGLRAEGSESFPTSGRDGAK